MPSIHAKIFRLLTLWIKISFIFSGHLPALHTEPAELERMNRSVFPAVADHFPLNFLSLKPRDVCYCIIAENPVVSQQYRRSRVVVQVTNGYLHVLPGHLGEVTNEEFIPSSRLKLSCTCFCHISPLWYFHQGRCPTRASPPIGFNKELTCPSQTWPQAFSPWWNQPDRKVPRAFSHLRSRGCCSFLALISTRAPMGNFCSILVK